MSNMFHWGDREVLITYESDAVYRIGPDGRTRANMLVAVPITFEDPNISLSDALRLLDGILTKTSRNPRFDWVLGIAGGMNTVRPKKDEDGFARGNWVAKIQCGAKYYKEYGDYLKRLGLLHYEEDEA